MVLSLAMLGCARSQHTQHGHYGPGGMSKPPRYAHVVGSKNPRDEHVATIEGGDVHGKNGVVVFRITGVGYDYKIYAFGGKDKQRDWIIRASDPEFELLTGWLYASGSYPVAMTKRVKAVGSGTIFVLQIDSAANLHRVYLLPDTYPCTVTVTSFSGDKIILEAPRTFVAVDARGDVIGSMNLDAVDAAGNYLYPNERNFIDQVVLPAIDEIG